MQLSEILDQKGTQVISCSPYVSLREAVSEMVRYKIGSLMVVDGDQVVGIVTERDILQVAAKLGGTLDDVRVDQAMSIELTTAAPDDTIDAAARLMTNRRVRHLPVLEQDELCGIVSIGDLIKVRYDELKSENHFMRSYINGEGAERGTQAD